MREQQENMIQITIKQIKKDYIPIMVNKITPDIDASCQNRISSIVERENIVTINMDKEMDVIYKDCIEAQTYVSNLQNI